MNALLLLFALLLQSSSGLLEKGSSGLTRPRTFASRAAATSRMDIPIYNRAAGGSYAVSTDLAVPSQYEDATLSFVEGAGNGRAWMIIDTEGQHGTALAQHVLLAMVWDGTRFRAAAAETLDYRCSQPTSPADYQLRVAHVFGRISNAPGLRLKYELTRNGQPIAAWNDLLRWNGARFTFTLIHRQFDRWTPIASSIADHITASRAKVTAHSREPMSANVEWLAGTGVMDVMEPACDAGVITVGTKRFIGKWLLDTKKMTDDPASRGRFEAALVVGWTSRALTFAGGGESSRENNIVCSLTGAEATVRLRGRSGTSRAKWEDERLRVTVALPGAAGPVTRTYYVEGEHLVVEESSGADGRAARAFYLKA